jgi:preprotein translocase subunit SecF
MSRIGSLGHKLYTGEVSYDFVGHRKRWYIISGAILLIAIASLGIRGLNAGIDFKGGNQITIPTQTGTVEQGVAAAVAAGAKDPVVRIVTSANSRSVVVQTENLPGNGNAELQTNLVKAFNVSPSDVSAEAVSATWGSQITQKALTGLGIFLVLIVLFLTIYFELKMALAALLALAHDLLITVGIYSLVGFTVTPATVIGVLTILGYSLYDTVVVFDKVRENTRGITSGNRYTYSQAANLAVNQTLVRSINTSFIALLPVAAILIVGTVGGAETLGDLSLALLVGIAAGTYSSIFIATPFLAQLKEHEAPMQALAKRVAAREAAGKSPAGTSASTGSSRRTKGAATKSVAAAGPDPDAVDELDDVTDGSDDGDSTVVAAAAAAAAVSRPSGSRTPAQRSQPARRGGSSNKRRPSGKKRR